MTIKKIHKAKRSYSHKKAAGSRPAEICQPGIDNEKSIDERLLSVRRLSPGPFQMIYNDDSELTSADYSEGILPEIRMYNCKNYECCLNVVAALDWEGFTCSGCNGEQNEQLIWRAQGECNKDQTLRTICQLPDLRQRKIESTEPFGSEFTGLRLVVNNKPKSEDQ